jgi:hypothetical protein
MRKIGLLAVVAALILVGAGAWMEWVTADSQARLAPAGDPLNPMQLMMNAKNLPHEGSVDYTFEFMSGTP